MSHDKYLQQELQSLKIFRREIDMQQRIDNEVYTAKRYLISKTIDSIETQLQENIKAGAR